MQDHTVTPREPRIDAPVFLTTIGTIVLVCAPIALAPQTAGKVINSIYDLLTRHFGILYQWYAIALLIFLGWLAFSRHGRIRLGGDDARPDFSTTSWIGMIFCAGVGATLMYWSMIEWAYYIDSPPLGAAPRSTAAIEWAATYGMYHWGPAGWAIFALPTLAIAYAFYQRGEPHLRLSTGCLPLLPGGVTGPAGRFIDFLYMLNLIGGAGTSLGLSAPMIAAIFSRLTGVTHDFALDATALLLSILIFGASAWLGLERGFKRLADANVWIALTLLLYVLAVGPTLFILQMSTDSLGLMVQNFVRMLSWTDPVEHTGFVESWTVFYWAWWVAYAPFVGIFTARISRGRTVRELIGGMLLFGSLGAAVFYMVLGNYSLHQELSGAMDVTGLMKTQSGANAIAEVIATLPLGSLATAAFLIVATILLATTYDSASFTLASVSSRELHAGENPARWNRVFWAAALGVVPITLMLVGGDIRVVQSATIVVSLPLLGVGLMLAISLMRMIREDEAKEQA